MVTECMYETSHNSLLSSLKVVVPPHQTAQKKTSVRYACLHISAVTVIFTCNWFSVTSPFSCGSSSANSSSFTTTLLLEERVLADCLRGFSSDWEPGSVASSTYIHVVTL